MIEIQRKERPKYVLLRVRKEEKEMRDKRNQPAKLREENNKFG